MHKQPAASSHRPKALTVFAAAFVAGAAAAVGVNRALDVHLAQAKPQIECEPIFVALRSLPQGTPVTIWDVALRDWPKAMLPTSALRAEDRFEGMVLRHPVREGQPLLSLQLARAEETRDSAQLAETYVAPTIAPAPAPIRDADLWAPSTPVAVTTPRPEPPTDRPPETAALIATEPVSETAPAPETTAVVETITPPGSAPMTETIAATETSTSSETMPEPVSEPAVEDLATVAPDVATDTTPLPSSTSAAAPAETTSEPAIAPVKRYLVVPERIAAQVETSFTNPVPPTTAETVPATQPAVTAPAEMRREPPTTAATPPSQPTVQAPATEANRKPAASQARRQPPAASPRGASPAKKSGTVPRVAHAPTLETHPNTEPVQRATPLDSWFPNLRAGFDAVRQK
jgi:hypothetical protein